MHRYTGFRTRASSVVSFLGLDFWTAEPGWLDWLCLGWLVQLHWLALASLWEWAGCPGDLRDELHLGSRGKLGTRKWWNMQRLFFKRKPVGDWEHKQVWTGLPVGHWYFLKGPTVNESQGEVTSCWAIHAQDIATFRKVCSHCTATVNSINSLLLVTQTKNIQNQSNHANIWTLHNPATFRAQAPVGYFDPLGMSKAPARGGYWWRELEGKEFHVFWYVKLDWYRLIIINVHMRYGQNKRRLLS